MTDASVSLVSRWLRNLAIPAIAVVTAWPVDTIAQETSRKKFISQTKEELRLADANPAYTTSRCMLHGIRVSENAIVKLRHDETAQLQLGDKIVAIDGKNLIPRSGQAMVGLLSTIPPDATIEVIVERNGERVPTSVHCSDSLTYFAHIRRAHEAIIKRDFIECIRRIDQAHQESGVLSVTQWMKLNCAYHAGHYKKSAWQQVMDFFEYQRLGIEEDKWDPTELVQRRAAILANKGFFEWHRQLPLYFELVAQLDAASSLGPVTTARSTTPSEQSRAVSSTGSGFFVSQDGLALTSAHVVARASRVRVTTSSGVIAEARVIALSEVTDLALLQVLHRPTRYLSLAAPRSASVGAPVFTYGYPVADVLGREPKFTDGTISALSGIGGEQSFLQISVPVQPGNSGGPLVNDQGYVVGVIAAQAAIAPFLKGTGTLPQNINWAVKGEYAGLLAELPSRQAAALGRVNAIEWVRESILFIEAESGR